MRKKTKKTSQRKILKIPLLKGVKISLEDIKNVVAESYGITIADLESPSRTEGISFARQVAIFLANELTRIPTPEIGSAFNRGISAVAYSRDKIKPMVLSDPFLKEHMESLLNKIIKKAKS